MGGAGVRLLFVCLWHLPRGMPNTHTHTTHAQDKWLLNMKAFDYIYTYIKYNLFRFRYFKKIVKYGWDLPETHVVCVFQPPFKHQLADGISASRCLLIMASSSVRDAALNRLHANFSYEEDVSPGLADRRLADSGAPRWPFVTPDDKVTQQSSPSAMMSPVVLQTAFETAGKESQPLEIEGEENTDLPALGKGNEKDEKGSGERAAAEDQQSRSHFQRYPFFHLQRRSRLQ